MSKYIIGIDLGGTTTKMAILSQSGEILQKWAIPTNRLADGQQIVPDIIASIQHQMELLNLTTKDFIGIGMGSPGQVDFKAGTVIGAYNLGWSTEQKVKEAFEAAFDLPFRIDNDANVAALGERWVGAGENADDVVFITLGTGVGGGVIAGGTLLHGPGGCAGEIGHISVGNREFHCTCGRKNCLETVASATGVVNLARSIAEAYAGQSPLKKLVDDGLATAKDVFDLAIAKDFLAEQVVQEFSGYLARACAHLGHILNPSYIVIGGGVSAAGDYLLEEVRKSFEDQVLPMVKKTTKLRLATLGNDAGVIGAASLLR